jgi:hypothetical protein
MQTEALKSREQEKLYHAIIGQIAKQAQHLGSRWNQESWKRFLIDQWASEEKQTNISKLAPSLDGERIVQLGMQSRRFTKEQGISFVEWLLCWAANNGVTIEERREYS